MPLGVDNGTVRLEAHDPDWEVDAKQTIEVIQSILKEDVIAIEHVGSTSIKSIPAKPIIDIAVGVPSVSVAKKHKEALEAAGFQYLGELVEGQRMYGRSHPERDDRTHHLHFVLYGSTDWQNYLYVRDYCNTHPEEAEAYAQLKTELVKKYALERDNYRQRKDKMIREIIRKARACYGDPEKGN